MRDDADARVNAELSAYLKRKGARPGEVSRHDNGLGNITWERDIPDAEFSGLPAGGKHVWFLPVAYKSRDGLGDNIEMPGVLDHVVQVIRDAWGMLLTISFVLVILVFIAAPVYTCIILPLSK
jgi:hypothetical protein